MSRMATRSKRQRKEKEEVEEVREEGNVLVGLTLSRDGKSVKIDEHLLRRLAELEREKGEEEVPFKNPFENSPIFLSVLKNGTSLTLDFLEHCSQQMKNDPDAMKMAEMIGNFPVDFLALKRSQMQEDDWEYNVKLSITPHISDQERSGNCWIYGNLNSLRVPLIKKFSLDKKFELSAAYVFFYDKIERANLFFEYMWNLRHKDLQDREVRTFTNPKGHFLDDGGLYNFFTNIVSKYGMVPSNVYGKGFNASNSAYMNDVLITVSNHMALEIFSNPKWTRKTFEKKREGYMKKMYDLIVRFLGAPPKPNDKFNWNFRDEHGDSHTIPNLTPEKFYRTYIHSELETKVLLVNDPRHPETYYCKSYAEYSTNMLGGSPSSMINLPLNDLKKVIYESLKDETCVWVAVDIDKFLDAETNTSDPKRFDFKSILGVDVEYDKKDMLNMLTSGPCHAMLFNGVDTVNDPEGNVLEYRKWRVENSWGKTEGDEDSLDSGYYRMTDDYVNKYLYEAVVDLKYFDQEIMTKIVENSKKPPFVYNYTDSLGGCRKSCEHCKKKLLKRNKFQ